MANIVIDSRFNPYTYDEMLKPALMETQAHQNLEEQMSSMSEKTSLWNNMINPEGKDKVLYDRVHQYNTDLNNQASVLSSQGLTMANRPDFMKMKQRYSDEIKPIEVAYSTKDAWDKEQTKSQNADNSLMYDKYARDMSLTDFMHGKTFTPVAQSGIILEKRASEAYGHFAKELRENPSKYKHVMGGQYWEKAQRNGFQAEDVRKAIADDPNASWALTAMKENLLKTVPKEILYNSDGTINKDNMAKVDNHINIGMASAIGGGEIKNFKDQIFEEEMKEKLFQARQKGPTPDYIPRYTSVDNLTINGKVKTTQLKEDADFLKQMSTNPNLIPVKNKLTMQELKNKIMDMKNKKVGEDQINKLVKDQQGLEYESNIDRLKAISKKYGVTINFNNNQLSDSGKPLSLKNNLDELSKKLEEDIKTSAIRDRTYHSNITDDDLTRKLITTNSAILYADKGTTGIYNYEKGEKKKMITQDDFNNWTAKGLVPTYNFSDKDHPIKIVATDKDNNSHSMVIDPKVIDDSDNSLATKVKLIQGLLDKHDRDKAKILIDDFMYQVRGKFNTLAQSEGTTKSAENLSEEKR